MILDTNTYSALKLNDGQVLGYLRKAAVIGLPLPVLAELKYGFINGAHADTNSASLHDFLSQPFVRILTPTIRTCDRYAEIRLYVKKAGRALSNNDIWIAALILEADDIFITYDKDFAVFQEMLGNKLVILYKS